MGRGGEWGGWYQGGGTDRDKGCCWVCESAVRVLRDALLVTAGQPPPSSPEDGDVSDAPAKRPGLYYPVSLLVRVCTSHHYSVRLLILCWLHVAVVRGAGQPSFSLLPSFPAGSLALSFLNAPFVCVRRSICLSVRPPARLCFFVDLANAPSCTFVCVCLTWLKGRLRKTCFGILS